VTVVIGVGAGHAAYFWPVWLLIPLIFGITGALKGKGSSAGSSEREARRAVRRERRRR
jgi:hypothetical protein